MFHTITRPIKSPNLSELAVHVPHVHMQKSLSNFMNQGPNGSFGRPTQLTSRTRTADVSLSAQDGTDRGPQLQDELHLTRPISRGCSLDSVGQPLLIGLVVATPS